jgi:hypothetical protein
VRIFFSHLPTQMGVTWCNHQDLNLVGSYLTNGLTTAL